MSKRSSEFFSLVPSVPHIFHSADRRSVGIAGRCRSELRNFSVRFQVFRTFFILIPAVARIFRLGFQLYRAFFVRFPAVACFFHEGYLPLTSPARALGNHLLQEVVNATSYREKLHIKHSSEFKHHRLLLLLCVHLSRKPAASLQRFRACLVQFPKSRNSGHTV